MKIRKLVLAFIILLITSEKAFSASVNATSNATITSAVTVNQSQALDFGSIVSPGNIGTVIIENDSNGSLSGTLSSTTSNSQVGIFAISGITNTTYDVTISSQTVLTRSGSSETMSFLMNNDSSLLTDESGNNSFYVGGSLTVAANQVAGAYAGTYTITVNNQ